MNKYQIKEVLNKNIYYKTQRGTLDIRKLSIKLEGITIISIYVPSKDHQST